MNRNTLSRLAAPAALTLALALLLVPRASEARGRGSRTSGTNVRLGLGADAWFEDHGGLFSLLVGVDTGLAGPLSVGGRFGVALATRPDDVAVPLDLVLRLNFSRAYVEAMGGPHIFFDSDEHLRGHAAFGFGLQSGALSFGIEAGYLDPAPVLGLRLGYRI
jgi:hypothetical protein